MIRDIGAKRFARQEARSDRLLSLVWSVRKKEVSMGLIDIVILAGIAAAFVAVCVRVRRKGACADCSQGGTCSGHCGSAGKKGCPALKGVDAVADDLGRGVH